MCGFCGFVDKKRRVSINEWNPILTKMSARLSHRGPNSFGNWIDEDASVALSHRRLAILDLSEAGQQPMHSSSGRFVIVFNGEIYNHLELREKLGDVSWRGHSDTETILQCIETWGIEKSLIEFRGMFSFSVFDKEKNEIILARDRFGEKPLYYGIHDDILYFASELKSLIAHPNFNKKLSIDAIYQYVKYSFIPDPLSIYKDIFKLPAGSYLSISLEKIRDLGKPIQYWNTELEYIKGLSERYDDPEEEIIEKLENQIQKTIQMYTISDVPIGTFLSGGIDSTLVTAILQKTSNSKVNTFTIGFGEKNYNEAPYAKEVANYLDTNHTEAFISAEDAISLVPSLADIYDEPFADSSQIPTLLLSKITSEKITVCLTGDAGDELFCGYSRYIWGKKIIELNPIIKALISSVSSLTNPSFINKYYDSLGKLLPLLPKICLAGDKLFKVKDVLMACRKRDAHDYFVRCWYKPENILNMELFSQVNTTETLNNKLSFLDQSMLADLNNYLVSNILVKVDRAAMRYSLETRVPFLDPELAKIAWRIPLEYKLKNKQSKWILRKILSKHIPSSLIDRPKMGFGVPIDSWLRGSLKSWSKEILFSNSSSYPNFINEKKLDLIWKEHQSQTRNWQAKLWNIIILKSWLKNSL